MARPRRTESTRTRAPARTSRAGITNRPPDREHKEQADLPKRGSAKDESGGERRHEPPRRSAR